MSIPQIASKNLIKWAAMVSIAVSTIAVIAMAVSTADSVQQVYADFGVAVPALSRFAYRFYPLTALSVILIWLIQRVTGGGTAGAMNNGKFVVALTIGMVAYIAWLLVMGVGLYLPYHMIGQIK